MIQYQSFVPTAHAARVFKAELALAQRRGVVPYLGVLKRHRADPFLMTHGVDGYSLALEFRLTARNRAAVWALAAAMDELVLGAGGRFYFAKDSTLDPARNRESARKLAALEPALVCFGHGPPERNTDRFQSFVASLARD